MSKLLRLIKNIILAGFFICGYNVLASSLNLIIPLNIITILYVALFGVSGLLSLIVILLFAF